MAAWIGAEGVLHSLHHHDEVDPCGKVRGAQRCRNEMSLRLSGVIMPCMPWVFTSRIGPFGVPLCYRRAGGVSSGLYPIAWSRVRLRA